MTGPTRYELIRTNRPERARDRIAPAGGDQTCANSPRGEIGQRPTRLRHRLGAICQFLGGTKRHARRLFISDFEIFTPMLNRRSGHLD